MTISNEIKDKALEIGRRIKAPKVWVNEKGEVFSEEQYAKASVGGDKEKYAAVEVTAEVSEDKQSIKDACNAILACKTADEVNVLVEAEKQGENRSAVLKCAEKKLKSFNQA